MKRQPAALYSGSTSLGLDVSKWQGEIDWPLVARSSARFDGSDVGPVEWACVRTGDGKDTDELAVRNLEGANDEGIPVGLYHYIRAKHGPTVNLDVIRDVINTARVPIAFVAIDVEGTPGSDHPGAWLGDVSTADVLACIEAMGNELEAEGHRVVIYTGQTFHWSISQKGKGQRITERWPLWTPYYTKRDRPSVPMVGESVPAWSPEWSIWQFAGSKKLPGSIAGIRGAVDLNLYRGSLVDFEAWTDPARRTTPPAPAPTFDRSEILELAERADGAGDAHAAHELRAIATHLAGGC